MFKINYDELFHYSLEKFITSYRNSFSYLYEDSWLEDEELMREHFVNVSIKLREKIYFKIKDIFSKNEIYWYSINNWVKTFRFYIWNFQYKIFFEENKEEKIRFIEDIKINKK